MSLYSLVQYAYYKLWAAVLRLLAGDQALGQHLMQIYPPALRTSILSRHESDHKLDIAIWEPYKGALQQQDRKFQIFVNWHASGFMVPAHGTNSEFCAHLAKTHNAIVIDADYRKAPEYPFPAALHDAEDVVRWVLQQPFADADNIQLTGYSAGGCLALILAGSDILPRGTIKHVIPLYAAVDLSPEAIDESEKICPEGIPGMTNTDFMMDLFKAAYVPDIRQRRNPLVSPAFLPYENFPPVTCVTAELDRLHGQVAKFSDDLRSSGVDSQLFSAPGVGHNWMIQCTDDKPEGQAGTPGGDAKRKAMQFIDDRIRHVAGNK